MTALFVIKFGTRLDQNCRRSTVLKFPAPYASVLTKLSKCHKICNFWQIDKTFITFYSPTATLFIVKFGSNRRKIVGEVAFWIFCPIGSHANENEKKS